MQLQIRNISAVHIGVLGPSTSSVKQHHSETFIIKQNTVMKQSRGLNGDLKSDQNIDCGYSLEPRGGSNEYPQFMFLRRNKIGPTTDNDRQALTVRKRLKRKPLFRLRTDPMS